MKALLALPLPLLLAACVNTSGTAVLTGTQHPARAPAAVTLYLQAPAEYDVIGLVDASGDGWTEQGKAEAAILELKRQAGKLGANGVLLTARGDKGAGAAAVPLGAGLYGVVGDSNKTAQGQAIWVR